MPELTRVSSIFRRRHCAALIAAIAFQSVAFAQIEEEEKDPTGADLTVWTGINYDTNLFRQITDENVQARTGKTARGAMDLEVGGRLDAAAQISKQRFLLHAVARKHIYSEYDQFDRTEIDVKAIWDWAVLSILKGSIAFGHTEKMEDLSSQSIPDLNVIDEDKLSARAELAITPKWSTFIEGHKLQERNNFLPRAIFDIDEKWFQVGARYETIKGSSVSLSYHNTKGDYPNRDITLERLDNEFSDERLRAYGYWLISGKSYFQAYVEYARREHPNFPERDFNGVLWRLDFTQFWSGKTRFDARLWHNVNASNIINYDYYEDYTAQLEVIWNYSPKLRTTTKIDLGHHIYNEISGIGAVPERTDNIFRLELTAGWEMYPEFWLEGFMIYRNSDSSDNGSSYDYGYLGSRVSYTF